MKDLQSLGSWIYLHTFMRNYNSLKIAPVGNQYQLELVLLHVGYTTVGKGRQKTTRLFYTIDSSIGVAGYLVTAWSK